MTPGYYRGLRGLTTSAALDLASDSVRVCSDRPGPIPTQMSGGVR